MALGRRSSLPIIKIICTIYIEAIRGVPLISILFLFSDDHATAAIGAYGSELVATPHLDRLAGEGVRLQRAFTQVSICRPSRCSLLTGLEAHRHGATGFQPMLKNIARWANRLSVAVL